MDAKKAINSREKIMNNSLCVSVIVPVYNQEQYLKKSIPSITNQTYSNLDIVIVDDGSTDSSFDIINEYAKKDSRIQIVKKANGGLVDATLAGIEVAKGELICFLDPDDYIGKSYIVFFVESMTDECDFVSSGFYYENKGKLVPYVLAENRFYTQSELRSHRDDFLCEQSIGQISNRFFISRWNKIYRTELIKQVAKEFATCKNVSLGEDTIFTYLMLCYARGGKTISQPNSYFYNISNQNSMMKIGKIESQRQKCENAFKKFKVFTEKYKTDVFQAYALYYMLLESVLGHMRTSDNKQIKACYSMTKKDTIYQTAKKMMKLRITSPKAKLKLFVRKIINSKTLRIPLKIVYSFFKNAFKYTVFLLRKISKKGLVRAIRLLKFQIDRDRAFVEVNNVLPKLEKRILPILTPFLSSVNDLKDAPIENNVFVFWWDGFEKAPEIVNACLRSVKKHHPNCNVITIDKDNYEQYTDIDSCVIKDFKKDKISVQTFSDILRFNLLKNNGGIWIDSTIFFLSEFNLLNDLQNKTFASLEFSTSRDFLKYGDEECSWSGFFIASRKNGLFVRAVDEIFKQYYLKYKTYSTYFFIDSVLMICKKHGLDDHVLNKTLSTSDNMFTLSWLLDQPYNRDVTDSIVSTPQKLRWNCENISKENTFYEWILSRE